MSRIVRFVLVGLAVAALVTAGVVLVVSETGGERASDRAAAGPAAAPGVAEPDVEVAPPVDEDELSIKNIVRTKRAAAEANLSTILYEVAQAGDAKLTPEEAARITRLPATGTGSLTLYGDGLVVVEADMTETSLSAIAALQSEGAEVLNVNERYAIVTAAVAANDLEAVARSTAVTGLREVLGPIVGGRETSRAAQSEDLVTEDVGSAEDVGVLACPGDTVTEGDQQLEAAQARSAFPIDGADVDVGIISDSFNHKPASPNETDDIASGDLPGIANPCGYPDPVQNIKPGCTSPFTPCTDEGRALAQIVHDLAPGADIAFSHAGMGESAFATEIERLWSPTPSPALPDGQLPVEADVIADDISYLAEPFFQDGIVANAVKEAKQAGVTYLSSAGNSNYIDPGNGKDMSSYEAPEFRERACPGSLSVSDFAYTCHDFNPSAGGTDATYGITVAPQGRFSLNFQWSQPRDGVTDDLGVAVYDSNNVLRALSDTVNTTRPWEFLQYVNTTGSNQQVRIVVVRFDPEGTGAPRIKWVMHGASGLSNFERSQTNADQIFGPTVFGHNGTADAISIAAVPYSNSNVTEPFSSRGPVTHYWGPENEDGTPASAITPTGIPAPDLAATDGGQNTFFGQVIGGVHRFFGTSASVAHAAGVAALLLQADPSLDPDGVLAALQSTAVPVPSGGGVHATGAGLVDAYAAVTGRAGSVTIQVDGLPDGPQDFGFASDAFGAELFALDDDAGDATLPNTETFSLLAGTEYTFTQSVPDGWDLTGLTCDAGSTDLPTGTATITLAPQQHVTCTYTNTQRGSITIEQETFPDDGQPFDYTSDGLGPFTLDGDLDPVVPSSLLFDDLEPGTYTVEQTAVAGFPLQSLVCDTGESVNEPSVEITLDPGEQITCAFTNHRAAGVGEIQIIQDSIDDHETDFGYTTTVPDESPFSLDDDAEATLPDSVVLTPGEDGTFLVTQDEPPAGWRLTGIECTNGATADVETATATITLSTSEPPTDGVTCVFTNTQLGSIAVVQDNVPDNGQDWAFTVTGGPDAVNQPFALDDDVDPALQNGQTVTDLLPGEYTITQTTPVPSGWTFVPPGITCTTDESTDTGARTVSVQLSPGEAVQCAYVQTNRQPDGWLKSGNPGAAFIGDNIYNLDGSGQKRAMNAKRGKTVNFYVKIQNDGGVPGSIRVKGSPSANGFTVSYFWGSKNVSGAVRKGTYTRSNVLPGPPANTSLRVAIKPATNVKKGVTRNILVRLISAETGILDVVRAQARAM